MECVLIWICPIEMLSGAHDHAYLDLCIRIYVYMAAVEHAEDDSGEFRTSEVEIRDKAESHGRL